MTIIQVATTQQLSLHKSPILIINVPSTLAMRWLIPKLPDFLKTHPKVDWRLSTLMAGEWGFYKDSIDAAIVCGKTTPATTEELFALIDSPCS